MGRKLRHLLMFLLIILKQPNMPEAGCSCAKSYRCDCNERGLTSIPRNLPTSITQLDLYGNQITMIHAGAFLNLPVLQDLYLADNKITMIKPGAFANLRTLRSLDLSCNKITLIKNGTFVDLSQLHDLDLSYNQISMIQSDNFDNLVKLIDLNLSHNLITMINPDAFANLSDLQDAYMSYNNITMSQSGTFANKPRLYWLSLDNNKITMVEKGAFANLVRLKKLWLANNQITTIQEGAFVNLPRLECLDIRNNTMTALAHTITAIAPLASHRVLSSNLVIKLDGNPWQCDCNLFSFRMDSTGYLLFEGTIICAQPDKFRGQKLIDINPEACTESTTSALPVDEQGTSNSSCNSTLAGSITVSAGENNTPRTIVPPLQTTPDRPESEGFYPDNRVASTNNYNIKRGKTRATISLALQATSDTPESGSSSLPVLIGYFSGSIAGILLISGVIITIWYKRRTKNPPSDPNSSALSNIASSNFNMGATVVINSNYQTRQSQIVMTSDDDHKYEDIDQHHKTGQGQSQAAPGFSTCTVAAVVTSGDDHTYEDIDRHNQTGQSQSQAITGSNTNATAAVEVSHHGQPQAIVGYRNPSYGTGQIVSMQSPLYKVPGQSE